MATRLAAQTDYARQVENTLASMRGSLANPTTWILEAKFFKIRVAELHKQGVSIKANTEHVVRLVKALAKGKDREDKGFDGVRECMGMGKYVPPVDNNEPPVHNDLPSTKTSRRRHPDDTPGPSRKKPEVSWADEEDAAALVAKGQPTYMGPDGIVRKAVGFVATPQASAAPVAKRASKRQQTSAMPQSVKKAMHIPLPELPVAGPSQPRKSGAAKSGAAKSAPRVQRKAAPLTVAGPSQAWQSGASKSAPRVQDKAAPPPEEEEDDELEGSDAEEQAAVERARIKLEHNEEALSWGLRPADNEDDGDGEEDAEGTDDEQPEDEREDTAVKKEAEDEPEEEEDEEEAPVKKEVEDEPEEEEYEEEEQAEETKETGEVTSNKPATRSSTRKGRRKAPTSAAIITSDMEDDELVDESPVKKSRRSQTKRRDASVEEVQHEEGEVYPIGEGDDECDLCYKGGWACLEVSKKEINQCWRCWKGKKGCSNAAIKRKAQQAMKAAEKAASKGKPRARSKSAAAIKKEAGAAGKKESKPRAAKTRASKKPYQPIWGAGKARAAAAAPANATPANSLIGALPELVKTVGGYERFVPGLLGRVEKLEKQFGEMSATITRLEAENHTLRGVVKRTSTKIVESMERVAIAALEQTIGGDSAAAYLGQPPNRAAMTMQGHLEREQSQQKEAALALVRAAAAKRRVTAAYTEASNVASSSKVGGNVDVEMDVRAAAAKTRVTAAYTEASDVASSSKVGRNVDVEMDVENADPAPSVSVTNANGPAELLTAASQSEGLPAAPSPAPADGDRGRSPSRPPTAPVPDSQLPVDADAPAVLQTSIHPMSDGQQIPGSRCATPLPLHLDVPPLSPPPTSGKGEPLSGSSETPAVEAAPTNITPPANPPPAPALVVVPAASISALPIAPSAVDETASDPRRSPPAEPPSAAAHDTLAQPSDNEPHRRPATRGLSPINEEATPAHTAEVEVPLPATTEDAEVRSSPLSSAHSSPTARQLSPAPADIGPDAHPTPVTIKRKRAASVVETPANKKAKVQPTRSSTRLQRATSKSRD